MLERYEDYHCSVMLLDVDFFKNINDTYGHQAGDTVLKELADIFRHTFRASDVVGRWGGEEFMVILPHTRLKQAAAAAENIRNVVECRHFGIDNTVTISVGVGELDSALTVHENIARVDGALYRAKTLGRNQISISEG